MVVFCWLRLVGCVFVVVSWWLCVVRVLFVGVFRLCVFVFFVVLLWVVVVLLVVYYVLCVVWLLAVQVRESPLPPGACCRVPRLPIWRLLLWSGSAHCALELAVEVWECTL